MVFAQMTMPARPTSKFCAKRARHLIPTTWLAHFSSRFDSGKYIAETQNAHEFENAPAVGWG